MITVNRNMLSGATFTLLHGEETIIQISGITASCILSSKILDSGATYIIQSAIESVEFANLDSTVFSDLQWENIKIDGIEYSSLDTDIKSLNFISPSFLYIKNTSVTQSIRFSLRGNR